MDVNVPSCSSVFFFFFSFSFVFVFFFFFFFFFFSSSLSLDESSLEDDEDEDEEEDEDSTSCFCAMISFGAFLRCSLSSSVRPPRPMEVKKFMANLQKAHTEFYLRKKCSGKRQIARVGQ